MPEVSHVLPDGKFPFAQFILSRCITELPFRLHCILYNQQEHGCSNEHTFDFFLETHKKFPNEHALRSHNAWGIIQEIGSLRTHKTFLTYVKLTFSGRQQAVLRNFLTFQQMLDIEAFILKDTTRNCILLHQGKDRIP